MAVSKQLLLQWNERKARILSQDFSFAETLGDQQARIARAQRDYVFFVESYFPHLAKCPCGKFQIDAAKYLVNNRNTRAVFEWARGHAKSTHLSLFIPLWLKIQKLRQINVMVLVSKSEDTAIRLLGDLQAELEYNDLFIRDYGKQVKQGSWAEGEFKTDDGCMFMAVGRGQSPRGIKERGQRPDYIVIDDIDDDEIVRNPKRVGDAFDWCLTALLGTMAMGRGRFVLVGNRIGKDSILGRFADRPGVHHTVVNALDKVGLPSWHENYRLEEIMALRHTMGERRFQKEYMNNPINEGAIFLKKHIRYAKMQPLKEYRSLICYTDPSFKNSSNADFKATLLVGKTRDGYYHVIKAYVEQTSITSMVAWHYDIHEWVDGKVPVLYYMESNFLQDLVLDEFKKEGVSCGLHIPVRGDSRKKPEKFARIEALQPLFERGLVIFNDKEEKAPGMMQLEEQLLMFERGSRSHDDAPDALEGAIFMLSKRNAGTKAGYHSGKIENRKY